MTMTVRDFTVGEILQRIGQEKVHTVQASATIKEAAELMTEKNIGALPVTSDDKLVGIVTDRDMVRVVAGVIYPGESIATIMTPSPLTVTRLTLSKECEEIMAKHNFRHLLVVESAQLVGIVSIKDILVITRSDQEFLADQLASYIQRPG